jgi:hypothetical protein
LGAYPAATLCLIVTEDHVSDRQIAAVLENGPAHAGPAATAAAIAPLTEAILERKAADRNVAAAYKEQPRTVAAV